MSNATAPTASQACPAWCTDHRAGPKIHPEDRSHWAHPELPDFVDLGHDPRLDVMQYVYEDEPIFMFELGISPDDMLKGPGEAAVYFRGLSRAFARLADQVEAMTQEQGA